MGTAYDSNGYGGIAYFTSETCGYVNGSWVNTGCQNNYASSDIKYVVDAWKNENAPAATDARLISLDDLKNNLGYELGVVDISTETWVSSESTPNWVYNSNYDYWAMIPEDDSLVFIYKVLSIGRLNYDYVTSFISYYPHVVARPVIVLPKSAL